MNNNADDIPQSERRRIMAEERRGKSTLHSHAMGSVDDERQGRYATENKPSVIGATPISYPKMESGPWSKDEYPPEPSLGYDINEQSPVGEPHEIEASQATPESRLVMSPVADGVGGGGPGDGTSLRPATRFRRRA